MAKEMTDRVRLGDVLLATGLITPRQLEEALALQQERHCRLGEALVEQGVLTQDQINWALARHFGLAYVDVRPETLDRTLVRSVRPGLLYQHKVIPLVRIGSTITLAMADPTDSDAVLEVSDTTGYEVEAAIASVEAILAGLDSAFSREERRVALAREPVADEFTQMAKHKAPRQRLGEILLDALLITEDQLEAALARQKGSARRLGEVFMEDGVLTEDQINWALARHLDIPYIDLTSDTVDPELQSGVPTAFLEEHRVVPVMRIGNRLIAAMADPLDHEAINELARATRCEVVVSIAPRRAIETVFKEAARARPAAAAPSLPVDLPAAEAPAGPGTPAPPRAAAAEAVKPTSVLSPEAVQAFMGCLRQSSLPLDEKIKVYHALQATSQARQRGGPGAERSARQQAFAALTPAGMKLALQLARQVGAREVPAIRDDDFAARHGEAGLLHDADRRFIVDRRLYDRTIRAHAQQYKLDPIQIDSAVMAARAYIASEGQKQILLISEGEKELAKALTQIIRLARTREQPAKVPAPPPPPPPPPYVGPERRTAETELQQALSRALAESRLPVERRDKVVRAFRLIHRTLAGTFDRATLKGLIRQGIFVGFAPDEIALVERLMRLHGYRMS